MSLSQDEINALLTGDDSDESETIEIMSPEEIAAMLDQPDTTGFPVDDSEAVEIMSPEAIAAMLEGSAPGDADVSNGGGNSEHFAGREGLLNPEEIDILGEVGNISMGAVATTMYTLLDRRVSITTPRVTVFDVKDVLSIYKIPFVVATIEYIEGITGNNLLVLKVDDAALITDLLMGGDGQIGDTIELNEMHLSAMSEIMNQMMGASSTSLSKLLRKSINISPPKSTQVDSGFDVSSVLGDDVELVTKISFDMEIEGLLKSELIQLMPYHVSREFAKRFMAVGMGVPTDNGAATAPAVAAESPPVSEPKPAQTVQEELQPSAPPIAASYSQETIPASEQPGLSGAVPPYPGSAPYPTAADFQAPYPQQAYPPQAYPPQAYPQTPYQTGAAAYAQSAPQSAYPAPGRLVDVHPVQFQAFDATHVPGEQKGIDLIYNIPLQVTVELGKTRKEISEILEFGAGTIVVLDKIAGDPVEIVVNGKLIARGEVVVIDENYGVRITGIING